MFEHLKAAPYKNALTNRRHSSTTVNTKSVSKTSHSTKPIFIMKKGTFYHLINVITCDSGKESYIGTKNSLNRPKLDSGIHCQVELTNLASLYNNETADIIDNIDLASNFEETRCFGVDSMEASDHDKNFNCDQMKTAVNYIEYIYANSCKRHNSQVSISHFWTCLW